MPAPTLHPDGRWRDKDRLLKFGSDNRKTKSILRPVHIFDEAAASGRSACGKASIKSKNLTIQNSYPSGHPVCRLCNYTGKYAIYGEPLA